MKRGDLINLICRTNEYDHIIEILKYKSELMQYKKGDFQFVIEEKQYDYCIDINIAWGNLYNSQVKRFSISSFSVNSFTGEGKKIKK